LQEFRSLRKKNNVLHFFKFAISIQIGSSSIFRTHSVRDAYTAQKWQRKQCYRMAVQIWIKEIVTETDMDEQKHNTGNQT